jgi:hypothetical protein
MAKPIVLHLGEPIKYNHDFYSNNFLARFDVVRNDALDRPSFIEALKNKRSQVPVTNPITLANRLQIRRFRRNFPTALSVWRRDGTMG